MGKKKGNKSTPNLSIDTTTRVSDDAAAQPVAPATEQVQQQHKAVEDMGIEELRAELLAARAELAALKSQADAPSSKVVKPPQEVQELHAKLQQLRKEQQEADAARDKAWKQLKAVVQEISSLANPDYLQSLVVKPQPE